MKKSILEKMRKLNWVLSESTTGSLSYNDLSKILCEIVGANILITNIDGTVLGAGYANVEDASTISDEQGSEKLTVFHTQKFSSIRETVENLHGEDCYELLGNDYTMTNKYHCLIPSFCGGERMGTLIVARHGKSFDEVDIALCEYGATVVGIEIKRNINLAREEEQRLMKAVDKAIDKLSFSEKDALDKIFAEIKGNEDLLVVSKVAGKYSITNSVIVNAIRKLESAGVLSSQSLGMKGTRIKITNPYLRQKVEELQL